MLEIEQNSKHTLYLQSGMLSLECDYHEPTSVWLDFPAPCQTHRDEANPVGIVAVFLTTILLENVQLWCVV